MNYNPFDPHCGPFNIVSKKEPTNIIDATCWKHDKAYGKLQEKGINPYKSWSKADEEFVATMDSLGGRGRFYSLPFKLKKAVVSGKATMSQFRRVLDRLLTEEYKTQSEDLESNLYSRKRNFKDFVEGQGKKELKQDIRARQWVYASKKKRRNVTRYERHWNSRIKKRSFKVTGTINRKKKIRYKRKYMPRRYAYRRRRRRRYRRRSLYPVYKRINKLYRKYNENMATYTRKSKAGGQIVAAVNQQQPLWVNANSHVIMENCLDLLPVYNPATNAIVTNNMVGNTYNQVFRFPVISGYLSIRNNDVVSGRVQVYLCKAKQSGTKNPLTLWDSGLADTNVTSDSSTHVLSSPTDSPDVLAFWHVKKIFDYRMNPGDDTMQTHREFNIRYKPNVYDAETEPYAPEWKSFGFLVVASGPIAHDGATVGRAGVSMDYEIMLKQTVKYDAGVHGLQKHELDDNSGVPAAPVVAQMDVEQNT